MTEPSQETTLSLSLTATAPSESATKHGSCEQEVVALFDELRAPLLRYLVGLGLAVQDGEEVVQEAFLALFQHLRRGRSRHNLRGWMFRVVHNLGLKRRRKHKECVQVAEQVLIADTSPSPEEQAADQQTHKHLLEAFRALPERDRRCVALRAEGLRYREIAAVLDISLGAVSISLAKSLARLIRAKDR